MSQKQSIRNLDGFRRNKSLRFRQDNVHVECKVLNHRLIASIFLYDYIFFYHKWIALTNLSTTYHAWNFAYRKRYTYTYLILPIIYKNSLFWRRRKPKPVNIKDLKNRFDYITLFSKLLEIWSRIWIQVFQNEGVLFSNII